MRVLHISPLYAQPVEGLPTQPATTGFTGFPAHAPNGIATARHTGHADEAGRLLLVDLHVSDLLNLNIPSNYGLHLNMTCWYFAASPMPTCHR